MIKAELLSTLCLELGQFVEIQLNRNFSSLTTNEHIELRYR